MLYSYYQKNNGNIDHTAPIEFLSAEQQLALKETDGKFRISLYKALLFIKIAEAIRWVH